MFQRSVNDIEIQHILADTIKDIPVQIQATTAQSCVFLADEGVVKCGNAENRLLQSTTLCW